MKQLHFLENITPLIVRCFSSSKQNSFTVSYLVNSCGLSPEAAIPISEKVQFENPKNPDSVLALLRNHGCGDIHISKIVAKCPHLLLTNPEEDLLPKLQFLGSAGLSHEDLAKVLVSNPKILRRSLEKNLIPTYNILKGVVDEENAVRALTKQSWIFSRHLEKTIAPNAALLRRVGVPMAHVSFFLTNYPTLCRKREEFSESVEKVMAMGFDPERIVFVIAVRVLCGMSESTWEQKMMTYRSWGLSEDEIMLGFRSHPLCLLLSEKKIMSNMGYLVKMGWQPATVARNPTVLFYSLEKRIIPRCSVMKLLLLKGLEKKDLCLATFLQHTERRFIDRFIIKYKDEVPRLLDAYHGKVGFQELGFVSEAVAASRLNSHIST